MSELRSHGGTEGIQSRQPLVPIRWEAQDRLLPAATEPPSGSPGRYFPTEYKDRADSIPNSITHLSANLSQSITVLHSLEALAPLRADWERLWSEGERNPFFSFAWFEVTWKHYADGRELVIVVHRVGEEVVAIYPLERVRERVAGIPLRTLRFALGDWSMHNSFLATAGWESWRGFEWALARLASLGVAWDAVCLHHWPWPGDWGDDAPPFGRQIKETASSVVVPLVSTAASAMELLPPSWRQNMKKRLKVFEKKGESRFVRVGQAQQEPWSAVESVLQDALRVSEKSWQHQVDTGWCVSKPENRGYFLECSHVLWEAGFLDLSVNYVQGTPVSFTWGPSSFPLMSDYKPGYDADWKAISPGHIHTYRLLEANLRAGAALVEYGSENKAYTTLWSEKELRLYSVYYYRARPAAQVVRWARRCLNGDSLYV